MFNTVETAKRIRDARLAQNMTQMELADAMDVSFQAVSNWERGNSMPDIGKLTQLCDVLSVSLYDLLGKNQEMKIVDKIIKKDPVTIEEVEKVAPLASPTVIEHTVQSEVKNGKALSIHDIRSLAPFLDREYLGKLLEQADVDSLTPKDLEVLAHHLKRSTVDALVDRFKELDTHTLYAIVPHVSRNKLEELADSALSREQIDFSLLRRMASYLSRDTLERILNHLSQNTPLSMPQIIEFAPFLSRKTTRELVEKLIGSKN